MHPIPRGLACVLIFALASPLAVLASRIDRLKPLYPATPLAHAGKATCLLVAPESAPLRAAADQLAREIERVAGVRPEIVADTAIVSRRWEIDFNRIGARHLVAFGNANSNRLLAVLWGEGYTAEDDAFPGPGGHVVRTVHDPFACGLNVVVLAGSDPEAPARAVAAFLARHLQRTGQSLAVPGPVVEVSRGPGAARPRGDSRDSSPEEMAASLDRRVTGQVSRAQDEAEARKPTLVNFTNVLAQLARAWFRTGDPGYPPLMKQLLDRHRALLLVVPQRVEMEGASASAMLEWDLVEELPVWTDVDRLEVANAFLRDALQGHERTAAYDLVKQGIQQVVTENHGTQSALNTFNHWRYFAKYYNLPEEEYWMSTVRAVFAGQLASHQMLEDSAAYTPFCAQQTTEYALRSRDLRYFELGIARTQMEFILQCCYSNLGLSGGFGDSHFLQFPWGIHAVARVAWFERDAGAAWWLQHYLPDLCGIDVGVGGTPVDRSLPLREPVQWTGLSIIPVYQQALGAARSSPTVVTTPKASAGPEWFNKVVFRERWSPEAQYLLLDGAGGSSGLREGEPPGPSGHSQDDINTIITYTDRGRLWLVDHTYSERAIQQHNGLTITRDGEMSYKSHLARLRNAAQGAGFAVTRSTFDDYSGCTWERTIFWRRGDHFVVLDRAIAETAGHFTVRCNYRALGEPVLRDGEMRLTQDGRYFQIRTAGGAKVSIDPVPLPDPEAWRKSYAHAAPIAQVLEQYQSARLASGESLSFVNFLKASDRPTDLDSTAVDQAGPDTVLARSGNATFAYGLARLPGDLGDGDAFALGAKGFLAAGLRRLGPVAAPLLSAAGSVDLWLEDDQILHLHAARETTVTLSGRPGRRFAAGDHMLDEPGLAARIRELVTRCRADAERGVAAPAPTVAANAASSEKTLAASLLELRRPIRRLAVADLHGDGRRSWLATGRDGLSAFAADGALLWNFAPGKPCGALATADLDGDGRAEIAVGCDDEKVYLVDAAGKPRWNYVCKPTERGIPPVPDDIRIADLDRDGTPEIVVGANYLHCLRPDGTVRWEDYWRYQRGRRIGDVQSFDLADLNRDGKLEVVCGIRLNYPIALGYNAEGKRVYPADPTGQPSHKPLRVHPPNATLVLDLFADGGPAQIVVGATDELNVRWTGGDRDTKRATDLRGARIALASAQPEGERPLLFTATDMGAILTHRASGNRADGVNLALPIVWRQVVGDKITALWGGLVAGRPVAVVGTQSGSLHAFDGRTGAPLGRTAAGAGAVVSILAGPDGVAAAHASGRIETLSRAVLR